jgi:hypothetical protein
MYYTADQGMPVSDTGVANASSCVSKLASVTAKLIALSSHAITFSCVTLSNGMMVSPAVRPTEPYEDAVWSPEVFEALQWTVVMMPVVASRSSWLIVMFILVSF